MLAWHHREPHWLTHAPSHNLVTILVGLPLLAYVGGWLLAGREPRVLARQPLD
ncbi:hypothetical protein [Micromonospora sp. URMC 103]|uniref:hypothetical protein n=1 Tax=Micromonospora sp. URMC 103 TaxID=3423406 RepID=UPI003F19862E